MSNSNITNTNDEEDNRPGTSTNVMTREPQSAQTLNDEGTTKSRGNKENPCNPCTENSTSNSSMTSIKEEFDKNDKNNEGVEEMAGPSNRIETNTIDTIDSKSNRPELQNRHNSNLSVRIIKPSDSASKVRAHGLEAMARIRHELREIQNNPPPNCAAEMIDDNIFHWNATIDGPKGTVYEGGTFLLDINFPKSYPFRPPRVRFLTRIYHCNIDGRGLICLDILNEKWSPVLNISKVLLSVWLLLCECNPDDPLVMAIAEQYALRRLDHDKTARLWVKQYAMREGELSNEEKEKTEKSDVESQTEVTSTSEPVPTSMTSELGTENNPTQKPDGMVNGRKEENK